MASLRCPDSHLASKEVIWPDRCWSLLPGLVVSGRVLSQDFCAFLGNTQLLRELHRKLGTEPELPGYSCSHLPPRLRLLHNTCCLPELQAHATPHAPCGFCHLLLPRTGWGLGQDWQNTEHLSVVHCISTQFILLPWDRQTASYITLHSPKSNVYSWTSCPGLGFTNQNFDFSPQRHSSFLQFHPYLTQWEPPTAWGKGGVLLRKHGKNVD